MAIQNAVISYRIQDATGVVKSYPDYITFDDATATLSSLQTYAQATAVLLDAVTAGKITGVSLTLFQTLPGGLKANPIAGSDVEETGLFTYNTTIANRSYGEDIPAIEQSLLAGKNIDLNNVDVMAWTAHQLNQALAAKPTSEEWASTFTSVRTAQKTFRKSRRALKRA